jgi:hypothetical protein
MKNRTRAIRMTRAAIFSGDTDRIFFHRSFMTFSP